MNKQVKVGNVIFLVYLLSMIIFGWRTPTIIYLGFLIINMVMILVIQYLIERQETKRMGTLNFKEENDK